MEIGESVKTPEPEKPEDPVGDKKPIKVRCVLLFDGTGNNKKNIERKEAGLPAYEKSKTFWRILKGGNASYENWYTNIASLDTYIKDQPAEGYDITVMVYTEGPGTRNDKTDKLGGYAIGVGEAGVKNKCSKGIMEAIGKILGSKYERDNMSPIKRYVAQLHFYVFAFSRGAATARYAIYKLILEENKTIKDQLRLHGFQVNETKIRFAGLFDTVSSHGISFRDDTRKLKLDAISEADMVVQLAAADEYRKNFSLTNIKSADKKGIEYFMPGAHSDVGGSYHELGHEGSNEDFTLYQGAPDAVKRDAQQLVKQGWYLYTQTEQQIEYHEIKNHLGLVVSAYTKGKRSGISNAYCRIPLKLMATYAKQQQVPINYGKLEADAVKTINDYPELVELDRDIYKYMVTDRETYDPCAPLLKQVRNKHLHMSAKEKIGMAPRFVGKGDARKRSRSVHEG